MMDVNCRQTAERTIRSLVCTYIQRYRAANLAVINQANSANPKFGWSLFVSHASRWNINFFASFDIELFVRLSSHWRLSIYFASKSTIKRHVAVNSDENFKMMDRLLWIFEWIHFIPFASAQNFLIAVGANCIRKNSRNLFLSNCIFSGRQMWLAEIRLTGEPTGNTNRFRRFR